MNFINEMRDQIKRAKTSTEVLNNIGDRIVQNLKAVDTLEGGKENELLALVFQRVMTRLSQKKRIDTRDFRIVFDRGGFFFQHKESSAEFHMAWAEMDEIRSDIFNEEKVTPVENVHPLIISELRAGNKIKAIKYLRDVFRTSSLGLKEAKDCADTLGMDVHHPWTYAEMFSKAGHRQFVAAVPDELIP